MKNLIGRIVSSALVLPILAWAAPDPATIAQCTTTTKGTWHVVFTETVKSKEQKDWTETYNAVVEVYKNGQKKATYRGSTLPNQEAPSPKPPGWQYSVVTATCALPKDNHQTRFYTWTRGKRAGTGLACLRLAQKVPTVNVGSSRQLDKFLDVLMTGSAAGNYQYAQDILVHSGYKPQWRGSAGCLTVHPQDEAAFFALIPENDTGTLELNRGIEDTQTSSSYCY